MGVLSRLRTAAAGWPKEAALDEAELLGRLQAEERDAYDEVVERYHRSVYHLVYRMSQNRADAEDLTQEVFIKALRSFHRVERASSLKAWLFKIAVNLYIDQCRAARPSAVLPPAAEEHPGPLASLEQKELQHGLQKAILRLPEKQRATLILRIFHQLTFREIAEVMESPVGTVKANYHHAVVRMRSLVT